MHLLDGIRVAVDRLAGRVALIGADPRDDEDLRARKALLVLISVLILPVAAFMALFFGFVVARALAMRHLPPAQGAEAIVGREGVVLAGGLDPEGVVRVAAEEWKATSVSGFIPEGSTIRVTKLDGLVLTVEPLDPERAPTGGALPARGGNT